MDVEIISIATEILQGMVVNTNATFLSAELNLAGFEVKRHTTIPDVRSVIAETFQKALERCHTVIVTGGLGPTCDDITREIAAQLFDSDFYFDEEVAADLKSRFGENLASLKDQATVPRKARRFLNQWGTAPALLFESEGKRLILLPGVPYEMKALFLEHILPYLKTTFKSEIKKYSEKVALYLITESEVDPSLRALNEVHPSVEIGIYPSHGNLMVCFSGSQSAELSLMREEIVKIFPDNVLPCLRVELAIQERLIQENKTLALAESCTGGEIAAHLTTQPGASEYFLGGIVAYSNALKTALLGVSEETLVKYGAVSAEVVEEMVQGLLRKTKADYGIAVSGIAGPTGGTEGKPIGTIWAAIGAQGSLPLVFSFRVKGERENIIVSATHHLLSLFWRYLNS